MGRSNAPFVPKRIDNGWAGVDINLRGTALLSVITACCASGFLLVGYDNGVFGGIINTPAFKAHFKDPSASTIGTVVSIYEIGCFFGALATFAIGEPLGRRRTILLGCLFMIAGAIIQTVAPNVGAMIAGRIISGLGMGAINSTVPFLQAETSPAISRGKLVCLDLTVLNIGICVSYWVDYAFNFSSLSGNMTWRIPIALQLVFIAGLIVTALVIPETPRWLASQGREAEALAVLERLANEPATSPRVQESFAGIKQALDHERAESSTSWIHLIKPSPSSWKDDSLRSRRRLLLACFIQAAQQLGGINALIYYSSTLFSQSIGLAEKDSALLAGGLNMALILGSVISIFLVDRVGRRKLLIPCVSGMALVMAAQTGLVWKTQQPNAPAVFGRAASSMLFIFELFFSIGFQGVVWLIPSEILPLTLRTKGSALSTASNWIMNFAIVKFTPSAIQNIKWRTYIVFAVLNAAWVPIIWAFLPETKNKTLEEIDELFAKDGWHIDNATAARDTQAVATFPRSLDDVEANEKSSKEGSIVVNTKDAASY